MQVLRFERHAESFLFISAWFPQGHSIQHLPVHVSVPELKSSKMKVMTRNCYHLYLPSPPAPTQKKKNPTLWLLFYNYTKKTFWRLQSAHQPVLYGLSSMHTAKKPKAITTIKNAILSRGISAKSLNRYKYLFKFRSVCVWERERRRFSAGKDDQYSLTNNITGSFFPLTDSTTTPHQIITIEQSWLAEQLLHFYSFS